MLMAEPKLTCATGRRYDTRFLMDGTVRIKGFDVAYPDRGPTPGEFFPELATTMPYDIGEQAFSHYLIMKDLGKPITAVPVFPSSFFPHLGLSIHKSSGVQSPSDLVGKRVASPDFGFNPAVWMRGILAHQYEVPVERIVWMEDETGPYGLTYRRPARFQIEPVRVPEDPSAAWHDSAGRRSSSGMRMLLETGQVDAMILPSGGMPPTASTRKLFDDPSGEIRAYVEQTGTFPINTVMTIREDTIRRYPELPARLMEACREALRLYHRGLRRGKETRHMDVDLRLLRDLGVFPTEYGIEPNRPAIRLMVQYCYEQGLIRRLYEPQELFVQTGV
jgi:4,5-dihydroxyphthalate decarboxylase